ncbi:MAG: hypothetical protein ACXU84_11510 [Xanthobacteraceae bacterium]
MIAAQFLGKAISMTDDLRGGTPEAARTPRRWWLAKECQRAADYGNNEANRCDASLATHAYNVPASAVSSRSELSRHFAGAHPSLIILELHEIAFAPRPGHYNAEWTTLKQFSSLLSGYRRWLSAIVVSQARSSCRGEGRQTSRGYGLSAVGSV